MCIIMNLIMYREHSGVVFFMYFLNDSVLFCFVCFFFSSTSLSLITVSLGNLFHPVGSAIQERSH